MNKNKSIKKKFRKLHALYNQKVKNISYDDFMFMLGTNYKNDCEVNIITDLHYDDFYLYSKCCVGVMIDHMNNKE
jgi:hypothetical protein